jgi:hypothetical protein
MYRNDKTLGTAKVTFLDKGLSPVLVLWWSSLWRKFYAAPRLVRVAALIGGVAAIPIAAFGFLAGDLLGIAAVHVAGDNGLIPGMLIGFLSFAAGALLAGGWTGAQIGKWLLRLWNSHQSN